MYVFELFEDESRAAAGATSHLKDLLETGSFSSARGGNQKVLMNRFSDPKHRFNEPSSRGGASYELNQNQRLGQAGLVDAAFVVRDRRSAYPDDLRDDGSTISSTRPSRTSSRPGS